LPHPHGAHPAASHRTLGRSLLFAAGSQLTVEKEFAKNKCAQGAVTLA